MNVVHWNGRDDDGLVVEDGVYIVNVEAEGHRQTGTVAVAR